PGPARAADRARLLLHLALAGGGHGQLVRLLRAAPAALRPGGRLARAGRLHARGAYARGLRQAAGRRRALPLRRYAYAGGRARRAGVRGGTRGATGPPVARRFAGREAGVRDAAAVPGALRDGPDGLGGRRRRPDRRIL